MTTETADGVALVTGGAGFIGSTLVDRLLAEGRRVVVIDNLSTGSLANLDAARRQYPGTLEFHRLELVSDAVRDIVGRIGPEVVFHCAMTPPDRAAEDPVRTARDVVVGTVNLLEATVGADVRKVVVASDALAIHGQVDRDDLPVVESLPLAPVSAHGAALVSVEPWLHAWQVQHGLEWTVLALGTAYGPRQSGDRDGGDVAAMVSAMLQGIDVTIPGDGTQTRDFVFVDDVVHALALAANRGHGRRYNIGTGRQTSLNQLFRALAAATRFGHDPIRVPEQPGMVVHSSLSSRRAAEDLGWKPWTTLQEGLVATLQWWAERT